jgi:hypothetical protein
MILLDVPMKMSQISTDSSSGNKPPHFSWISETFLSISFRSLCLNVSGVLLGTETPDSLREKGFFSVSYWLKELGPNFSLSFCLTFAPDHSSASPLTYPIPLWMSLSMGMHSESSFVCLWPWANSEGPHSGEHPSKITGKEKENQICDFFSIQQVPLQ